LFWDKWKSPRDRASHSDESEKSLGEFLGRGILAISGNKFGSLESRFPAHAPEKARDADLEATPVASRG